MSNEDRIVRIGDVWLNLRNGFVLTVDRFELRAWDAKVHACMLVGEDGTPLYSDGWTLVSRAGDATTASAPDSAAIDQIVDTLSRLIHERDATLTAIGLPLDADEGELADAAARIVADLHRHERLSATMIDVARSFDAELIETRKALADMTDRANRQRDLIDELCAALGVDRTDEDAASELVAMAHAARTWRPATAEMAVFHAEAFPCL